MTERLVVVPDPLPADVGPVAHRCLVGDERGHQPENRAWRDVLCERDANGRLIGRAPLAVLVELLTKSGHPKARCRDVIWRLRIMHRVDRGEARGDDFLGLSRAELPRSLGAIRRTICQACTPGTQKNPDIRDCAIYDCPAWPYRMGHDPHSLRRGGPFAGAFPAVRGAVARSDEEKPPGSPSRRPPSVKPPWSGVTAPAILWKTPMDKSRLQFRPVPPAELEALWPGFESVAARCKETERRPQNTAYRPIASTAAFWAPIRNGNPCDSCDGRAPGYPAIRAAFRFSRWHSLASPPSFQVKTSRRLGELQSKRRYQDERPNRKPNKT